ncbi:MAG: YfhO family protein [Solirubrobacterales bacterium]|nr:YfhO family protein [Solirubrobacterales bacterium]
MRGMQVRGARLVSLTCWPLAVVAGILIVNFPALVHLVDVNPLGSFGVTASHITPGFLPGLTATDPNVGYTAQALGHRAALDWLHGQVPWWNPLEGIGSPLAAELQSAAFFPPVLLFALPDGSLYFHICMEIAAGLSTWFLVRELGVSRPIATVGGLLFGLCGTFDWLWHAPMNPVPLLPLALLGVERISRRPRGNSGWIILALALALSLYAGFPETAYLDLLFVVAWATLRLIQAKARVELLARYLLGAVTGLLLSLPLLVPVAEYLPHAATNPPRVGYHPLHATALPMLGLPYLYGPIWRFAPVLWFNFWGPVGGFVTATTIVLAIAGLLGSRRDLGLRYLLALVAVGTLLWSFGVEPFAGLSHLLPYMSRVVVRRFSAPVWELAAIIAACLGLEAVGADRRSRAAVVAGGLGAIGLGAVMLLGTSGWLIAEVSHRHPSAHIWAVASVVWSSVGVVLVTGLGCLRRRRWSRGLVGALLVLDAAAIAFIPQLSAPRSVKVDMAPVRFLARHLDLGRYYGFGVYHANYGSYFGIASLDTSDGLLPKPWKKEIVTALAPNWRFWRFDGTPFDPRGPWPARSALSHIGRYEALDVRYFVVKDPVSSVFGRGPSYSDGIRKVFDDRFVSIFALPHPKPYFTTRGARCSLRPDGREAAVTSCSGPATLVRSEIYLPGWSATVNGHAARVRAYGRLLTSVQVGGGRSMVRFSYTPPGIPLALAGFAVGLLLLGGVPVGQRLARRRVSARASSPSGAPPRDLVLRSE